MNILDTIIDHKKVEVENRKQKTSIAELKNGPCFKNETLSFKSFLKDPALTGIVAEFKRQSPSKGIINNTATVEGVTSAYKAYGASAISVLTDHQFFGGSINDLLEATINEVPLLRKDFIIDDYQLYEAKAYGADIILLIAACLSRKEVKHLADVASDLGMEVLLEITEKKDLDHICNDVDVVGVNNRDLKTFTVNIQRSLELATFIPSDKLKISESGIHNIETIALLKQNGYNGFLIGEMFMKENDPALAFKNFCYLLKQQK
ncbi:MAG: indole-3-glycerol phosphate synthase TrpC [Ginsengibacter sp.]